MVDKLKKVSKALTKASKMHKNQSKVIDKHIKKMNKGNKYKGQ